QAFKRIRRAQGPGRHRFPVWRDARERGADLGIHVHLADDPATYRLPNHDGRQSPFAVAKEARAGPGVVRMEPQDSPDQVPSVRGANQLVYGPRGGDRRLNRVARRRVEPVDRPLVGATLPTKRRGDPEATAVRRERHHLTHSVRYFGRWAERSPGVGPEA